MSSDLVITRGDDLGFTALVTRSGAPVDLTGAKAWFSVKSAFTDPDTAALIAVDSSGSSVVITALTGTVTVTVAGATTYDLPAPAQLVWDLQIKEASGTISTVAKGSLDVDPDVTRTTA